MVRSLASDMGSDSFLVAPGYLSTSSRNRFRMANDASWEGLPEPVTVMLMPSKNSSEVEDSLALNRCRNGGEA